MSNATIYLVLQYQDFSASEYGTSIQLVTTSKADAEAFYEKHTPKDAKTAKNWCLCEVENGEEWPTL